ncbi:DUF2303 family protein [Dyella sp.]|uniref:DUF2303 family protein n=1 Tax=Dyella sp. TaxID=1869338 RepID=UPI002FDADE8D
MDDIKLIQDTAVTAAGARRFRADQADLITLAKDEHLESLEPYQGSRQRFRGSLKTNSLLDFASYVKAQTAGIYPGFVDVDRMAATVFFNLGDEEFPGHADWRATLSMQPTAAYLALTQANGRRFSQADLIDWLEDWHHVLNVEFADGNNSLARAITAIRKLKITTKAEETHVKGDFTASRGALEEVEASSSDALPTAFFLVTTPYDSLSERTFTLKLSVLTGGDKPALVLRWLQKEQVQEDIAHEFKQVLGDQLGDSATLTIGTFEPGK